MKTETTFLAMVALLAPMALSTASQAEIEQFTITGVRTPILSDEMATAVTVIGRADIESRQSFQLVEILRDVPGLSVARTGSIGSQAQLRLRGTEANHVLVLIDGVEVNDPASGDEFLFEHLNAEDIERIEVIRGPQSALWGSDAVAGVINIVTRKGGEGFGGSASIEAGSFGTVRGAARLHDSGENWRASFGVSAQKTDGTNVSRVGSEDDGYQNVSANAALSLQVREGVVFEGLMRHVDSKNDFDPVDFVFTGLPFDGDRVTETRRTNLGAVIRVDRSADLLAFEIGANWLDTENENFSDGSNSGTTSAERWKAFVEATYTVAEGHRLTAAIDHEISDFSQRGLATIFGDPNQDQSMSVTGYVIDYVGEMTNDLTITASARHDDNSDFENVTTWRIGASYDLTDATRLRGSVGRGQKSPSFVDRFGFFADVFLGNPNIKPETSQGFEFGIEHAINNGDLRFGLTYFNSRLEDEIDGFFFDLGTFTFTAVNKPGKSEREGLEATFDADIGKEWTVQANITYTESKEPDGSGGLVAEVRRPEVTGALGVNYQAPSGLNLNVNASYVGSAKDRYFPPFPQPPQVVELEEYVLLTVAARYPVTDRVSVFGRVENALDETYEDVFGFATPGLAAYGGVKLTF